MNPFKMFSKYQEAEKEAKESRYPLWDTHSLPERYGVGYPTIEMEDDDGNEDWEELEVS